MELEPASIASNSMESNSVMPFELSKLGDAFNYGLIIPPWMNEGLKNIFQCYKAADKLIFGIII